MSLVKEGIVSSSGLEFSTDLQFYVSNSVLGRTDYTLSAAQVLSIEDIFGTNPYQPTKPFYTVDKYTDLKSFSSGSTEKIYDSISIIKIDNLLNYKNMAYDHAVTPWIYNNLGTKLFRFHHLSDGDYTNRDIKIAIERMNNNPSL